MMSEYRFSVIVPTSLRTDDEILAAADEFADAACTDASLRGHPEGMELLFARTADSLQGAIASAIADVERAGYRVSRVETDREMIRA